MSDFKMSRKAQDALLTAISAQIGAATDKDSKSKLEEMHARQVESFEMLSVAGLTTEGRSKRQLNDNLKQNVTSFEVAVQDFLKTPEIQEYLKNIVGETFIDGKGKTKVFKGARAYLDTGDPKSK